MSKKPIKSNLFRFVTLRGPQAIDNKESKTGLIIPDEYVKINSEYYQAVSGVTDETQRSSTLKDFELTITPFPNKTELKTWKVKLYDFSSYLMRNKDYLTYESIADNLPSEFLTSTTVQDETYLTNAEDVILWDNLIHATLKKSSTRLREACIQMLIANKFLKAFKAYHTTKSSEGGEIAFTDQEEKEFTKLANASVVIEKEVLLSKPLAVSTNNRTISPAASRMLKNELILKVAQKKLDDLNVAIKDLEQEEKVYEVENRLKYESDLAAHKASVQAIYDAATPETKSYTDPITNEVSQIDTYPGITPPKFNFEPLAINFQSSGEAFTKSSPSSDNFLSTKTKSLLMSEEVSKIKNFEDMKKALNDQITKKEKEIVKAKQALAPQKAKVGGLDVTLSKSTVNFSPYDFYGSVLVKNTVSESPTPEYERTLELSIYTDTLNPPNSYSDVTFLKTDGTEIIGTFEGEDLSDEAMILTYILPSNNSFTLSSDWLFSATYTFENGDTVRFSAPLRTGARPSPIASHFEFEGTGEIQTTSTNNCFPAIETQENISINQITRTIASSTVTSLSGGVAENSFVGEGSVEFKITNFTPSVSTLFVVGFTSLSGTSGIQNIKYGAKVGGVTSSGKLSVVGIRSDGSDMDDPWGISEVSTVRIERKRTQAGGYELVVYLIKNPGFQLVMDTFLTEAEFNEPWKLAFKFESHTGEFSDLSVTPCEGSGDTSDPTDDSNTTTAPSLNGVINLGIADYLRVEQEVCCYVPGEVSHIENIMAKEYKEKSTRNLVSSEITTEQTRETEIENLTDTTSTERNELSTEASTVIDQQNSVNAGANTSVSGGGDSGPRFSASANFGTSSSTSTSVSNSQAQNYAQEITERALDRVVTKVSSKRTSRVLREFEENNKHGFDNTKGIHHITGVYRWVDKIYENQIFNYGKRLMYEFAIPEPARFLKEALMKDADQPKTSSNLIVPVAPEHPDFYISKEDDKFTPAALNADNYQQFASYYNAEVNAHPAETIKVTGAFDSNFARGGQYDSNLGAGFWTSDSGQIEIPDNYQADSAEASINYIFHHGDNNYASLSLQIGGISHSKEYKMAPVDYCYDEDGISFKELGGVREKLDVAFESYDTGTIAISVLVSCTLTTEAKEQWQNETYNAIMDAYYTRVQEYNDFQRAEEDLNETGEQERIKFNPAFNRSMEKRELKRCAIELLTQDIDIELARNRYKPTNYPPQIITDENLPQEASAIKFFEQAFDWEIMAYTLYPYYYAQKSRWESMVQEQDAADPIFQAFFQSGMARVVVPVRPGFEAAVNWYQATGEIWLGQGMVTDIHDELYLSVAEELTDPAGTPVGSPWTTKVPTSLTIVQGKSVLLDQEGLPCRDECGGQSQFTGTSLVISGGTDSNAADGVGADIVGVDNDVA